MKNNKITIQYLKKIGFTKFIEDDDSHSNGSDVIYEHKEKNITLYQDRKNKENWGFEFYGGDMVPMRINTKFELRNLTYMAEIINEIG